VLGQCIGARYNIFCVNTCRYFNTVGSKEGWTPSTFVSSRTNRKKDAEKTTQQRPEDFMDDEDRADAEDAQRVQTAEGFSGLGTTEEEAAKRGGLVDLFRVEGETIGVKLLKKMGWKEGQGIGPKIRRNARLGGINQPGDDLDAMHLFAPENTHMISFTKKNDHKGLGYEGEAKLSRSGHASDANKSEDEEGIGGGITLAASKKAKKKKPVRGGIGIGILNDTGSDDEDPYEIGPRISYNKVIGGDKKKKKPLSGSANPSLRSKPVFISKKAAMAKASAGFRKCRDGRLPLDGFILSINDEFSSVLQSTGQYAPPEVPEDWKSSKQARPGSEKANFLSTADAAKLSNLDPKSRAAILGEAALPGKSVFDFLSPAARERLASASGKCNLPPALGEIPEGYNLTEEERQKELLSQIPKVDKYTAEAALSRGASGFMPYGEDESKRNRYRTYLENQAGIQSSLLERAPGFSRDDWLKELKEFANCAQIFKPMSGMMATRFTSSTSAPKQASDASEASAETSLLSKPAPKPEDPAEQAAKLGMYGPMTRSSKDWYPTRLLCKRFNVKPPSHVQPGSTEHADEHTPTRNVAPGLVSKTALDEMMMHGNQNQNIHSAGNQSPDPVSKKEEVIIDIEKNEALEGQRAGEAVFKAIFGDDSDEDD
jgi:G patch domain-containing protein 1